MFAAEEVKSQFRAATDHKLRPHLIQLQEAHVANITIGKESFGMPQLRVAIGELFPGLRVRLLQLIERR
jgi:hypothetical protein